MPNELYIYTPDQLYNVFHAHTLETRERWELARFANPNAANVKFPWEGSGVFFTEKERRKIEAYIEHQKAMGY